MDDHEQSRPDHHQDFPPESRLSSSSPHPSHNDQQESSFEDSHFSLLSIPILVIKTLFTSNSLLPDFLINPKPAVKMTPPQNQQARNNRRAHPQNSSMPPPPSAPPNEVGFFSAMLHGHYDPAHPYGMPYNTNTNAMPYVPGTYADAGPALNTTPSVLGTYADASPATAPPTPMSWEYSTPQNTGEKRSFETFSAQDATAANIDPSQQIHAETENSQAGFPIWGQNQNANASNHIAEPNRAQAGFLQERSHRHRSNPSLFSTNTHAETENSLAGFQQRNRRQNANARRQVHAEMNRSLGGLSTENRMLNANAQPFYPQRNRPQDGHFNRNHIPIANASNNFRPNGNETNRSQTSYPNGGLFQNTNAQPFHAETRRSQADRNRLSNANASNNFRPNGNRSQTGYPNGGLYQNANTQPFHAETRRSQADRNRLSNANASNNFSPNGSETNRSQTNYSNGGLYQNANAQANDGRLNTQIVAGTGRSPASPRNFTQHDNSTPSTPTLHIPGAFGTPETPTPIIPDRSYQIRRPLPYPIPSQHPSRRLFNRVVNISLQDLGAGLGHTATFTAKAATALCRGGQSIIWPPPRAVSSIARAVRPTALAIEETYDRVKRRAVHAIARVPETARVVSHRLNEVRRHSSRRLRRSQLDRLRRQSPIRATSAAVAPTNSGAGRPEDLLASLRPEGPELVELMSGPSGAVPAAPLADQGEPASCRGPTELQGLLQQQLEATLREAAEFEERVERDLLERQISLDLERAAAAASPVTADSPSDLSSPPQGRRVRWEHTPGGGVRTTVRNYQVGRRIDSTGESPVAASEEADSQKPLRRVLRDTPARRRRQHPLHQAN
ncbi:hypothetical protein L228DRAFT_42906 [Xylona heveae TC161]|uniref:Uncharacterized protein n=1 Tax=Xylona heveae (strain CBS 132557 / TC161) TaxID=1328760 RepID=A0A164ZR37_XYLHT|nr:hypothetical protein L228DRAFT_42906 [Xylona heveae TC161]KZF19402.1 hypothetical protein L228DRAFT_42906 [Xylona heveae TC161]